jgi:hypothetical protein
MFLMTSKYSEIDLLLLERVTSQLPHLQGTLDRRTSGLIPPNAEISLSLSRFKTKREKFALALASWWLGNLGVLIRIELEESEFLSVRIASHSKAGAVQLLFEQFSNRDFYGNLLPLIVKVVGELRFTLKQPEKAKKKIRRRGYQDHGSLRPSSSWKPKYDWSFIEEQNEIERLRQSDEDTYQFLLGLMGLE